MSDNKKSIIPPTGDFDKNWPVNFNLPQGASGYISAADWTYGNEGFIQQTFLGASIRNFNISAGFGDTSSTLSVNLVDDEYNVSDKTGFGLGDDPYHGGIRDQFHPPAVGSPVFFKFGKTFATVEQAWRPIFDVIYRENTLNNQDNISRNTVRPFPTSLEETEFVDLTSEDTDRNSQTFSVVTQPSFDTQGYNGDRYDPPNTTSRGIRHLTFGGILQSYTQNKSTDANGLYSVQAVDPREILSNTVIILNNYAGSIFNNKNYFNVYGFLEYDISDSLKASFLSRAMPGFNIGPIESTGTWVTGAGPTAAKTKNDLEKIVDITTGNIFYVGNDMYRFLPVVSAFDPSTGSEFFPMTGQGFSRRGEQGIPWYRVRQALNALFNYNGALPQEFVDKGFGGPINFRGYNYVVDFKGIPIEKIPQMYFLNFDQTDLLSLCQELCDVISHDLFITLLPVINHPASKFLFDWNTYYSLQDPTKVVAGIIRVDAIDRSNPPAIGTIKTYLDSLQARNILVTSQDVGYELSNVATDKLVAGAQEVDMYFFSSNKDRDNLHLRKYNAAQKNSFEELQYTQWNLETSLKQQILPFYGFLGKDVPTIPIGFGPYQQILLDTSTLDAFGVGNYYIATEMELRCAATSYEQWVKFLMQYNDIYMSEVTGDQYFWQSLSGVTSQAVDDIQVPPTSPNYAKQYGVVVPRCVFISDQNTVDANGYPISPCCPPYGYPLYYKRAEKIGIPQAGITKIENELIEVSTNQNILQEIADQKHEFLLQRGQSAASFDLFNQDYMFNDDPVAQITRTNPSQLVNKSIELSNEFNEITKNIEQSERAEEEANYVKAVLNSPASMNFINMSSSLGSASLRNARKVYDFIKNVADKHLGKTFLVKVPAQCNLNYNPRISIRDDRLQVNDIIKGPFGFQPLPINSDINNRFLDPSVAIAGSQIIALDRTFEHYLDPENPIKYTYGALKSNFNPISDKWDFNYVPETQGGFFNYNIFDRNISFSQLSLLTNTNRIPLVQSQLLAPSDLTNFESNSRIKAYVRFNHSEYLDLSSLGKQNIYQQIITARGFIPDVLEDLNNTNINSNESFNQIQRRLSGGDIRPPSVAFVSCEVDENLYLIPKTVLRDTPVFARKVKLVEQKLRPTIERVEVSGCVDFKVTEKNPIPIILLPRNGGVDNTTVQRLDFDRYNDTNLNSYTIQTEKKLLDNTHVYAIITLPDKVIPTVDQRYMNAEAMKLNTLGIQRAMTIDVVRGAPGFEKPGPIINGSGSFIDCNNFTLSSIANAHRAQREAVQALSIANIDTEMSFSEPSPVYPDLVALPLMSKERCYGPWISSSIFNGQNNPRIRYSDIGGKVEFVKDENLAPWNFGGYQLMNEAGALQAQFSNSLLLFSERGGFTVADMPNGIILAKPLSGNNGPLVTSISIDIGDNSVQTTIKMDLYTSRFGKLQKQKEEAIGQITRERQKIIDQNNLIARKGLLKSTTLSRSFDVNAIRSVSPMSQLAERGISHIVADKNGVSFMTPNQLTNIGSEFVNWGMSFFASKNIETAGTDMSDLFEAGSSAPNHPTLSSEFYRKNKKWLNAKPFGS